MASPATNPETDGGVQAPVEATDSAPKSSPTSHKRRRSSSASGNEGRERSTSTHKSEGNETHAGTPGADVSATPRQDNPPLPTEAPPPLPNEPPPEDDGWEALFEPTSQSFYFYNRFTQVTQWENPRIPQATQVPAYGQAYSLAPGVAPGVASSTVVVGGAPGTLSPPKKLYGGYNPAIHGDYDPNADYAKEAEKEEEEAAAAAAAAFQKDPALQYAQAAQFNRFTGRFQDASIAPENYNDENKSRRQLTAFFDVDAAANSHDGRSLKAERQGKRLTKKEVKAFKEKRREKKEEKRRAWLRD